MLEKVKKLPGVRSFVAGPPCPDAKPILEKLGQTLRRESDRSLEILASRSADLHPVHELHVAIDNLTNTDTAVRQAYRSKDWVSAESALSVIDAEIFRTEDLIKKGVISKSIDAGEVAMRTVNRLFVAKQNVKQEFGLVTALDLNGFAAESDGSEPRRLESPKVYELPSVPQMVLTAAMMYQLRLSLFPAERMIVGAACRIDGTIKVVALFDVTGEANPSGVKADPDRLGQALIAMAETGTYFGIWIHSHPGTGPGATHPSSIDLRQHSDWLKHYSPDLVSAIMVRDRYVRFWGTAVETGKIDVVIEGAGISVVSPTENVYRLVS